MNRILFIAVAFTSTLSPVRFSQTAIAADSKESQRLTLVFQIDREAAADRGLVVNAALFKRVSKQAQQRIEQLLASEKTVSIAKVTANTQAKQIVVEFAEGVSSTQLQQVKATLLGSAWIEFALLANEVRHSELIKLSKTPHNLNRKRVYKGKQLLGLWCPVAKDKNGRAKIKASPQVATRAGPDGENSPLEFLVVVDPEPGLRLTRQYFLSIEKQKSERGLQLSFKLSEQGGTLMRAVTSKSLPAGGRQPALPPETEEGAQEALPAEEVVAANFRSRLAIIINGKIHMAPTINGVISTMGVIDGNFTDTELDELVHFLELSPMEVPLVLVKEE